MIHRQLITQLKAWAEKEGRKPLVLRGARQVGKTTLVDDFGKTFDVYIRLNLELQADAQVFSLTDNVTDLFQYVCLQRKLKVDPTKRTLLFIDEIQNEPRAVAMLRYFYEQMPWLHVIAAGSRLQTLIKQRISFPVGRVEYLSLRPCSFLEYLDAIGQQGLAEMVRALDVKPMFHELLMSHFNRYTLVGGMPEALSDYAQHEDVTRLMPIYKSLLDGYNEDVERYARNDAQTRVIRHILTHGWGWAGQTITFTRFGGSNYTSKEVHEAFDVMQKAFLLNLAYPVTTAKAPIEPALTRQPKLIWLDSGIMNFSVGIQTEYLQNKSVADIWRGHAAEQIVAQELRTVLDRNYRTEQCYWVRDKKGSNAEVDYVWQAGCDVIPIEVKAGGNSHLRSLHSFMSMPDAPEVALRVWPGEYRVDELESPTGHRFRLLNIPYYYVGVIDEALKMVR